MPISTRIRSRSSVSATAASLPAVGHAITDHGQREITMSNDVEIETDAEREQIYKRGYVHGVMKTVTALGNVLGSDDRDRIDVWVRDVLTPWEQDAAPSVHAPAFPTF